MIRGKKFKKSLSLVLALVMILGMIPANAATTRSAKHSAYVALGDAMTFGVGLDDPDTEAYYVKVAEALGYEDDWYAHADSAYRVEELRYLLDNDYSGDGYTKTIGGLAAKRETVQEKVANAEVITINIGTNNFSTYVIEQMVYYLENNGAVKYSYSFDQFADEDVVDAMENIQGIVMEQLLAAAPDNGGDEAIEMINYVTEVATYALMSYITSFNGMVDAIYELNSDVELYIVGLYNPAQNEVLTFNYHGVEKSVPVGEIFGALTELANAYIQVLCHRVHAYTYVDPGTPELLIDQMGDKSLTADQRIPSGLMLALLDESEGAAIREIQDMFAEYGVEKSEDEALEFLEALLDTNSAEEREEIIMDELNGLVVEEIAKAFEEKMQTYLGQFANSGDVVTSQEIAQLLADLNAAADEAARQAVADAFVEDLISDPELQKQAAAKLIYDKLDGYGLQDCVTLEDVEQMLTDMENCGDNEAARKAVVVEFVHQLAVAKVTLYVQGIVGESYTEAMADAMLTDMENAADKEAATAIAKEALWKDAFRQYMIDKIDAKFSEKGLEWVNTTAADFVDDVYAAGDDYEDVVRSTVRASAAKMVADKAMGYYSQSQVETMFADMDQLATETEKKNYLKNKLDVLYSIVGDTAYSAYESYIDAAETSIKLVGQYLDGVDQAAEALANYNDIQADVVDNILEMYAENYKNGSLDLGGLLEGDDGLKELQDLRETASKAIMDGYAEYVDAIEVAKESAETFSGYLDPIYELLLSVAEVQTVSLNDLVSVANKVTTGGQSYVLDMVDNLMTNYKLADDEMTIAYLAVRYFLADGMMIMPSADGHAEIAENIIKAIETGKSVNTTAGYWANRIIDGTINIYSSAKAFRNKPVSASGQASTLINPEVYVALGGNITTGDDTYVSMLGDALAMEYKDAANLDSDKVLNYAIDGLRAEDLLVLVNNNYYGDAYTEGRFGTDYLVSLRQQYQADIENADLITIEVGINNLVTFPMTQTLLAYNGDEVYEMDWGQYLGEHRADQLSKGKDAMFGLLLGIANYDAQCEKALNTVSTAVESLAYSLLGYIFHLDDAVESIAELNEDGTIVLIGFYNPLNDTYLQIDKEVTVAGKTVDLSRFNVNVSAIFDKVINVGNRYLANYVGNTEDDCNANDQDSRLANVTILDTELKISDYADISKDLSTLANYKKISVNGKTVMLKVPEYFLKAGRTAGGALHPNANGHLYIRNQILELLDFEIHADVMPEANEKVYGDADPDLNAIWDDASSLYHGKTVVSVTREEGENVGTYKLTVTVEENGGYYEIDVEESDAVFTITARPITVKVVACCGKILSYALTEGTLASWDASADLADLLNLAISNDEVVYENANYDVTIEAQISTEHNYVETERVDATCTEDGYVVYTCACGDSYTETLASNGHSYVETERVGATCTEDGYVVYTCSCGDSYTVTIKAEGHSYEAVVTEPTCTEQGYTTYTCACGDSYEADYVDANGHSYGDWYVMSGATCTEDGVERRDCDNCDHFETRAIASEGHSYEAVVTEPTCTEQGYTTYTCACGDSYVADYVDANGHSYGAWYTVKDATTTEKGEERRDCANCDHFETRETDMLEPDVTSIVITVTGPATGIYGEDHASKFSYTVTDSDGNPVDVDGLNVTVNAPAANADAGNYFVDATYTDVDGYSVTVEGMNYVIEPCEISIQVIGGCEILRGDELPEFSFFVTDSNGNDITANVSDYVALTNIPTDSSEIGTFIIGAQWNGSDNYVLTSVCEAELIISPVHVCYNGTTGVYYEIVHLAVLEANAGDTIYMIANSDQTVLTDIYHYAGEVNLINGVTLDLQGYTLKLNALFAAEGNYVTATLETEAGVGGRLVIPAENFVLTEAMNHSVFNDTAMSVLPMWIEAEGCYVFGRFGMNTTAAGRGFTVNGNVIRFQFKHMATGYLNQNFIADNGVTDNEMRLVVYLQWVTEDGIAYQTFEYNDVMVAGAAGAYDYTFVLANYSELDIDIYTLTISAGLLTDSGAFVYSETLSYSGVVEAEEEESLQGTLAEFESATGAVCENVRTGVQYEIVHEAVQEAQPGDTIRMIANSDQTALKDICKSAGMVNLTNGVNLDLSSYTLKLDCLVVAEGSYITADLATATSGGRLVVPENNLVILDAYYHSDFNSAQMYALPMWVNDQGCYLFGRFGVNTTAGDRGYTVDGDVLTFQFKHVATGYLNQNYIADNGMTDNLMSLVVYLQWQTEDGIAYQTFQYNDVMIAGAAGAYDYTFMLANYSELDIDINTLYISAQIISNCGATASSAVHSVVNDNN